MFKNRLGIIVFLCLLLTGCMMGPGVGDYTISLIKDFEVVRINSSTITIAQKTSESNWGPHVIPPKLLKVGFDEQYILALTQPIDDQLNVTEDESLQEYYIFNTLNNEISGPLSRQEFEANEITKHIELKSLDQYNKNY
ncbi:MAG: DUF3997 domain-containing protein [Turicibacter sp.]